MDCPFSFGAASFSPAVRSPVCIKEMCSAISCSIPLSAQAIAARTALRIARALEDPWAFKTGLEIPRKGVAPPLVGIQRVLDIAHAIFDQQRRKFGERIF